MALVDKIFALTQRATAALRINNALIVNWISMRGGDSFDNPVPYCDVDLPDYSAQRRGMPVTLDAGYDNDLVRLFTGGVYARGDEDPDALRTQCFVRGRTDDTGATIVSLTSVINPPAVWPAIQAGQYIDFTQDNSLIWEQASADEIAARELVRQARIPRRPSGVPLRQTVHAMGSLKGAFRSYKIPQRDLSGLGIKAAMTGILDDAGCGGNYSLLFDDYTLAPSGAVLDRMPASQMLDRLMMLRGCSVQQLRSGVVLIRELMDQPAPTASFKYKSSELAYARVIDNPNLVTVPFNPLLQIGMTIEVEDEATGVTGMWYLWGHDWELGEHGDWSHMDLRGGEDFGGAIGQNPIPQFTYTVDLEYVDDVLTAFVQFDGQASYDPDGTLTGADLTWSDNQTPALISGTGFRKLVVVAVADIVAPWLVNLHGVDSDGLTGDEEQTVDVSATGSAVQMPALGVAAKTYSMFSPDSAGHWNDNAESDNRAVGLRPSDGVHFGQGLYGFEDGHVELTRDRNLTRTTVLAAVGSPIKAIAWDWRNTLVAWVLTHDLRLYVSLNMDDTTPAFGLYGGTGLRTTLGLPNATGTKIGLPAAGDVYVYGGNGNGYPLTAYDIAFANHWTNVVMLGDILTDGPGSADLAIADFALGNDVGDETMILKNAGGRLNGSIAIYHTTDAPGPSRTWTRATGLDAGLVDGRAMLGNAPLAATKYIAIFADRNAWKSTDGIAYTKTANILPAGFLCNHAMWISDVLTGLPPYDGLYLLALEDATGTGGVYKSVDELSSEVTPLRDAGSNTPWPAGSKGEQLSIGAPAATAPASSVDIFLAAIQDTTVVWRRKTASGPWTGATFSASLYATRSGVKPVYMKPRILKPSLWYVVPFGSGTGEGTPDYAGWRSVDQGATWAEDAELDPIIDYARRANGDIYKMVKDAFSGGSTTDTLLKISTDDGASFTQLQDFDNHTASSTRRFWHKIGTHPTDSNKVLLGTRDARNSNKGFRWAYSSDGGVTFNDIQIATGTIVANGDFQPELDFIILQSGRIVAIVQALLAQSDPRIYTSDDWAQTWTLRHSETPQAIADLQYTNIGGSLSGGKIVFLREDDSQTPFRFHLMVSTDQGLTWASAGGDLPMATNTTPSWEGIHYDPASDTCVAMSTATDGAAGAEAHFVAVLSPVESGSVWQDVSPGVRMGGAALTSTEGCIALVPRS